MVPPEMRQVLPAYAGMIPARAAFFTFSSGAPRLRGDDPSARCSSSTRSACYFTAVDDHKAADDEEDAGAGMIGTVEFNASTLYRYANVDVDALARNLGDVGAARRALESFVHAFATSMPTGKQNTFANRTLPDAVVISVRQTQPVNLVGAFEEAIVSEPRLRTASERLAEHATEVDATFGTAPIASWVIRTGSATDALDTLGSRVSLDEGVRLLGEAVSGRLEGRS